MKRILFIITNFCFFTSLTVAQQSNTIEVEKEQKSIKQFSVFTEGFIDGESFSANVDFTIFGKKYAHFSAQVGLGILNDQFSIPIGVSLLIGKKKHYLESGIGMAYLYYGAFYNILRIGYRYQNKENGLFFRAGLIHYMNINDFWTGSTSTGTVSISIGYSF